MRYGGSSLDTVTPEKRHYIMSKIRGKDTSPEILVRKYLFSMGLRYRKNDKKLPGHPDIVFPKYHTVVFINGCFWHGHEGCRYFRLPSSNVEFWEAKIKRNRERDAKDIADLQNKGWRVITVWECQVKRKSEREASLEAIYNSVISEQ